MYDINNLRIILSLFVLLLSTSISVSQELPLVRVANAEEPTLQERAIAIADEYKISKEKLFNLIESESGWDVNVVSEHGDCGLTQLNEKYTGIPCEEAKNPDIALKYTAQKLSEGKDWMWTPCSCIQYAKALGVKIPKGFNASDFKPNTTLQALKPGDLVLFKYRSGESHIGVFWGYEKGKMRIKQSNLVPCKSEELLIDPADKNIKGFHHPATSP